METSIAEALSLTFGHETPTRRLYEPAANLDTAGHNMNGTPRHEVIAGLVRGKQRALVLLNQAIKSLEEQITDQSEGSHAWPGPEASSMDTVAGTEPQPLSLDVFIVHGHDVQFKNQVADILRRAGLNPIVLHE